MLSSGLLDLPWWGVVLFTLAVTHVTIAAVTIYLHRHQAHRGVELHPAVAHFFRFWLWLTTGMVTREWVAIHRKHHARCETPEDPHSPQVRGIRAVLWHGAELYRQEARDTATLERYGRGTPDDWLERRLYTRHSGAGIIVMLGIDLVLFGAVGLTVWAVQMAWIPFWAAGVINGLGHWFGYRTYDSPDASTNIVPWGLVIGGEELHNNHHAYPGSARFSARPFELDLGWFYIRALQLLGLASVKQAAPRPARIRGPAGTIDQAAAQTISQHRFQVLARYGRDVLDRVYRDELRRFKRMYPELKGVLKRARSPLLTPAAATDAERRTLVCRALESSQRLRVAYDYRERLRGIWQRTAQGPEQMTAAVQQWCQDARASGIEALEEFAQRLGTVQARGR